MYELAKRWLLDFLEVPPEPEDPLGTGESLLVFRAAPNYLRYKLILWAIRSPFFLSLGLGLAAGLTFFAPRLDDPIVTPLLLVVGPALALLSVVWLLLSYMMVRLDYELRWYKVTDKSLRIREGVSHVREMTMTFANIQNISITQGPIQRLLGIADLKVQSAGGGGSTPQDQHKQSLGLSMHTGYFRGVDNAVHIRDLMRERLKASRDSGLGDPDQVVHEPVDTAVPVVHAELGDVLGQLRSEATAFRRAAEQVQ